MTDPKPYSRVYWSVMDDKKFDDIRADMRHLGSWTVMLVVAEMAYPAPAFIPPHVPRASLKALQEAGLIDLLAARMYRIRGLKKEREARSERGKAGAAARWEGNATAMRPHSEGNATGLLAEQSRDEQSKGVAEDEQRARETLEAEEADLFAFLAKHGAYIRPDTGFGRRLLGLIDRRGIETVMEKARAMDGGEPLSDRQWVFGLEEALEAIPSPPMDELPVVDEKSKRIYERMVANRLELYRHSGKWDPEWGPVPEGVSP